MLFSVVTSRWLSTRVSYSYTRQAAVLILKVKSQIMQWKIRYELVRAHQSPLQILEAGAVASPGLGIPVHTSTEKLCSKVALHVSTKPHHLQSHKAESQHL